ncbi:MAG: hypothetical protein ABI653_03930 [Bacteroidota bacterium]
MLKFLIKSALFLFLTSCSGNSQNNQDIHAKNEHTLLITSFSPAFEENSEIVYSVNDLQNNLSILLKSKNGHNFEKDTFFYKTKILTDNEVRLLDAVIDKIVLMPTIDRKGKITDGITINFDLIKDGDTTNRLFKSPYKEVNPIGFNITSDVIKAFRKIFNDPIVSGYFDDAYNYFSDSTIKYTSKDRPIDKLRIKKYGWQIK